MFPKSFSPTFPALPSAPLQAQAQRSHMQAPAERRKVVGLYNYRGAQIVIWRTPTSWSARATVPTRLGAFALEVMVPQAAVTMARGYLARVLPEVRRLAAAFEQPNPWGEVGFFDELEQLGKDATFQQVTRQIDQVVNDPMVQGAAGAIPIVGTVAKVAGVAAGAARGLGEGGTAGMAGGALRGLGGQVGGAGGAALNAAGQLVERAAGPALTEAAAARSAMQLAQAPRLAGPAARLALRVAAGDPRARQTFAALSAAVLRGDQRARGAFDHTIAALAQAPLNNAGAVPPLGYAPPAAALYPPPASWQAYTDPEPPPVGWSGDSYRNPWEGLR